MVIKAISIILILIGLYTLAGWTCHSENMAEVRKAFNIKGGCSLYDNSFK